MDSFGIDLDKVLDEFEESEGILNNFKLQYLYLTVLNNKLTSSVAQIITSDQKHLSCL